MKRAWPEMITARGSATGLGAGVGEDCAAAVNDIEKPRKIEIARTRIRAARDVKNRIGGGALKIRAQGESTLVESEIQRLSCSMGWNSSHDAKRLGFGALPTGRQGTQATPRGAAREIYFAWIGNE